MKKKHLIIIIMSVLIIALSIIFLFIYNKNKEEKLEDSKPITETKQTNIKIAKGTVYEQNEETSNNETNSSEEVTSQSNNQTSSSSNNSSSSNKSNSSSTNTSNNKSTNNQTNNTQNNNQSNNTSTPQKDPNAVDTTHINYPSHHGQINASSYSECNQKGFTIQDNDPSVTSFSCVEVYSNAGNVIGYYIEKHYG